MKPAELLALLREFFQDRHALWLRHQASAKRVDQYEANNTYQFIIARDEVHLSWLRDAIDQMGGSIPEGGEAPGLPGSGDGTEAIQVILRDDAGRSQLFVDRWHPRVDAMTHARHKLMLGVILGETLEQKRFFEQALAGRTDLLGRRPPGASTGGRVLPTRWIE